MAGGYKVPENSLNGIALGAANVASSHGADAAYYNPANMVFMKDEDIFEIDLIYIGLNDINYKGTVSAAGPYDVNSEKENFFIPSLHYVSSDIRGVRFGLSVVSPGGLSKRWSEDPAKKSAEEFTLQTVEVNPTIAFPICDNVAVAIGVRALYSKGIVKATPVAGSVSQSVTGDSVDLGYNLALSYKPAYEWSIGLTYRSKINLTEDGDSDLVHPGLVDGNYDVSVEIPMPALLDIAVAYRFISKTTVEFVYERNFWHSFAEIDFNYSDQTAETIFGTPKSKNWKDTNTFRLGVTHELEKFTLMGGLVIDKSPVPDSTFGFELPDSDSVSVSLGGRYQMSDKINIGLATLYSIKEDRSVTNANLSGEFTDITVLFISAGLEYKF